MYSGQTLEARSLRARSSPSVYFGWPTTVCDALNQHLNIHVKTWISSFSGRIRPSDGGSRSCTSIWAGALQFATDSSHPCHPSISLTPGVCFSAAYRALTSPPNVGVECSSAHRTYEAFGCSEKTRSNPGSYLPVHSQQASSRLLLPRPPPVAPVMLLCLQQPDCGPKVCVETGPQGSTAGAVHSARRPRSWPSEAARAPRGSAGMTGLAWRG